jgi:hypothetical protein
LPRSTARAPSALDPVLYLVIEFLLGVGGLILSVITYLLGVRAGKRAQRSPSALRRFRKAMHVGVSGAPNGAHSATPSFDGTPRAVAIALSACVRYRSKRLRARKLSADRR